MKKKRRPWAGINSAIIISILLLILLFPSSFAAVIIGNVTLTDSDVNPSKAAFNFTLNFNGSNLTGTSGHMVADVSNPPGHQATFIPQGQIKFRNMGSKSFFDYSNINSVILHNFTDEWGQGYSNSSAFASYFPPNIGDAVQFIVSNGSGGWYHGLFWIANITAGQNVTFLYKLNNQTNNNTFADLGICEVHKNATACLGDFANNCEWESTGAKCMQRPQNFRHEIPPADCNMLPKSACNGINDTFCYWDATLGTYGKCVANASFNPSIGLNCTNIINQSLCQNQPFTERTGLCSWDSSSGIKCKVNNSKTFNDLQKPPVFFCEAPGYVTNRSQCENLSENYFMPCGWNNVTSKCGPIFFDFDKFNNFESIGSESTCQSAGGSWRSESAYDPVNGKITTESWCEFGVAVKTFGQIGGGGQNFGGGSGKLNDCSVDCFACEFTKNGSRWASSVEASAACSSSSAGCNFRTDSNAFNGYGWCNPAAGFGGFNCNNFCGDCNLMPNASNACEISPKGCKWDNMTNFCIEEGYKGCNQDCMQCIGQQSCQQSPANGGCNWDQSTLFCQPKGGSFEICFDGSDNDNNGATDCKDFKCSSDPFCGGSFADKNSCFSQYGPVACESAGCAWINDTFGFQFCAPKFEQCFRNETLQTSQALCDAFSDGATCKFRAEPECDENTTTVNICIGYGNNDALCRADSRCNYKNFTEIFGGQGGFCDTKGVVKCEENQTLRTSQAACESAGCVWEGNQGFDAVGFFSPCVSPCFNSSIGDSTKCAAAGSSISPFGCAWKTGSCDPKNFIGGCPGNDGDYSACVENTNCNWFEDAFGPVRHYNGSSNPIDFFHPNAVLMAVGLQQPVGGLNESNYTLSMAGANLTLIMTKDNVSSTSSQPPNISRLICRQGGFDFTLMQLNITNGNCTIGRCSAFANATCGTRTVYYFINNVTKRLEVLWDIHVGMLALDALTGNSVVTDTSEISTVKIDGNLSEYGNSNESATAGDRTNATRVRLSSGFCNDGFSNNFFQGMEENPPVPIAGDADDSTFDYVDIIGLGVKKTPEAYMYGIPVDNLTHSALCRNVKLGHGATGSGSNKSKYYLYLDTNGKTTGSCSPDDDQTITGFEYKFSYIVEIGQDNNLLETFLSQKCQSGSWAATNIPLKSEKRKACDLIGGPIIGVDKDTLTGKSDVNTSAGWRAYATATNSSGNSSSVLDKVGPGSADFKGIDVELLDCTSTSDKDNSQCSKFKQFGFFPGEFGPACKDSKDNDGDGLTDCSDSDCTYDPFFCGNGQFSGFSANANDKTSPSLVWTKLNTKIPTALSIIFDTDEPSNGTVKFYNNDSKCSALNNTLKDKALEDADSLIHYRPHHVAEVRGLSANETYFYKMEVCDPSGNCATSKCSNATTALRHSNVTFRLEIPSGWSVDIPSINLSNYSKAFALKGSTEYLHDINITIKSPDNSSAVTFVGVDIFEKQTLNTSEFLTGTGYVGIDANQYQSFKQKTGLEETLVKIPSTGTDVEHCDEDGLNCKEVTDNVDCIFASTYTECEVPDAVGLGFSTYKATSSSGGSGGGGGGGGGGSGGGGGAAVVETLERSSTTKFWDKLNVGQQASMSIDKIDLPITKVAFTALNELTSAELKVAVLKDVPITATFISHSVYEYLSIDKKNIKESDISAAEIEFRVDNQWIAQNGNGEVILARYSNIWEEIPTVPTGSDFEYSYYKSTTPGFSYFAITMKQQPQQPAAEPIADLAAPTGAAVMQDQSAKSEPGAKNNYIEVMLVAGIILVIAAILISRKHRHFNY